MNHTSTLIAHCGTMTVDREFLKSLPTPPPTRTHQPVPHWQIVEALIETLGFRHISVVRDEYAVSPDGHRMFGVLDLDYEFTDVRFAIGIRNANDKSMRLAMTVGYKVLVCDNLAFQGDFIPILARHARSLDLIDLLAVGVDKMQRNFEPLKQNINQWHWNRLTDEGAKSIIYDAFFREKLVSLKLLEPVDVQYFQPVRQEFQERTLWSLSNAFTAAFKLLKPIQQFKAASRLSPFLNRYVKPF